MSQFNVTVVGAGLAGSEAALVLAQFAKAQKINIKIKLVEMRPAHQTLVHKSGNCAELVCSNSFKSFKFDSAAGMLKYELAALGSPILEMAFKNRVDAGKALAVDRIKFSESVSDAIFSINNIDYECREIEDVLDEAKNTDYLILATGPLTSDALSKNLVEITGNENLAFFDAAAPIVMADSLDRKIIFEQDRYSEESSGDYLNAPMDKQEYEIFIDALLKAKCIVQKDFEKKELFQACQPIEEIAKSGFDAPRFGPMKPVGLIDPRSGKRPYAAVQLRAENKNKTAYNLVGFQTNLCFPDQQYVLSLIPGLAKASIVRYGVMHRNTFLNAPQLLDKNLSLKCKNIDNIYIAGQLGGTEGYLEAVRSGHHVAISILSKLSNAKDIDLPGTTAFGSLLNYATNEETKNYQPMHVNFGIIDPLDLPIKNKKQRYNEYANRGRIDFDNYVRLLYKTNIVSEEQLKTADKLKEKLAKLWQ